jgi:hypothetical protein
MNAMDLIDRNRREIARSEAGARFNKRGHMSNKPHPRPAASRTVLQQRQQAMKLAEQAAALRQEHRDVLKKQRAAARSLTAVERRGRLDDIGTLVKALPDRQQVGLLGLLAGGDPALLALLERAAPAAGRRP